MRYPKIGEIFKDEFSEQMLQCVEGNGCNNCWYMKFPACRKLDIECDKYSRPDRKNVYFKKYNPETKEYGIQNLHK